MMRKQKKNELEWGANLIKAPSKAIIYPHFRLGFAVLKQAIVDLKEADPLIALPALCWWLEESPDWLAMLELIQPGDDTYFVRLIGGCTNGKTKAIS